MGGAKPNAVCEEWESCQASVCWFDQGSGGVLENGSLSGVAAMRC